MVQVRCRLPPECEAPKKDPAHEEVMATTASVVASTISRRRKTAVGSFIIGALALVSLALIGSGTTIEADHRRKLITVDIGTERKLLRADKLAAKAYHEALIDYHAAMGRPSCDDLCQEHKRKLVEGRRLVMDGSQDAIKDARREARRHNRREGRKEEKETLMEEEEARIKQDTSSPFPLLDLEKELLHKTRGAIRRKERAAGRRVVVSWPEKDLVGMTEEEATRLVMDANSQVLVQVIPFDTRAKRDHNDNRVRIFLDEAGKVIRQPVFG